MPNGLVGSEDVKVKDTSLSTRRVLDRLMLFHFNRTVEFRENVHGRLVLRITMV